MYIYDRIYIYVYLYTYVYAFKYTCIREKILIASHWYVMNDSFVSRLIRKHKNFPTDTLIRHEWLIDMEHESSPPRLLFFLWESMSHVPYARAIAHVKGRRWFLLYMNQWFMMYQCMGTWIIDPEAMIPLVGGNESCSIWMSRVPHKWAMFHMNELWHTCNVFPRVFRQVWLARMWHCNRLRGGQCRKK